jgi:hypothetical protein
VLPEVWAGGAAAENLSALPGLPGQAAAWVLTRVSAILVSFASVAFSSASVSSSGLIAWL